LYKQSRGNIKIIWGLRRDEADVPHEIRGAIIFRAAMHAGTVAQLSMNEIHIEVGSDWRLMRYVDEKVVEMKRVKGQLC